MTGLDLTGFIRPGDTVLVGGATGEPRSLVEALIDQRHAIGPITVFVGPSFTGLFRPEHTDAFRYRSIGGIGTTATLTRAGVVDVLPVHLGTLPGLIASDRLHVDVALVQLSPPDGGGQHRLGLTADYLQAAIAAARITLAEVNPRVPRTRGDTAVDPERLAAVVHDDRPLVAVDQRAPTDEDRAIAAHVAERIPDGATVQVGVGGTPDAVLAGLLGHRHLGIHSGLLSDPMVTLVEAGAVTGSRKEIDPGVLVGGALYGSERLYRWADDNPMVQLRPTSHTHDPGVLSRLATLHAVNSAIEVDLSGQINAEMVDGRHVGLIGGQGAFTRAAISSTGGRSFIALPSTARGGAVSRIVARLGDGVTTTARADADLIVTEHGVADLRGRDIAERAAALIAIAHPDHREDLERAARR